MLQTEYSLWTRTPEEEIIPIPGTKKSDRVIENAQAVEIELSDEDLQRIEAVMPLGAAAGTRYPEALMNTVNR